MEGEIVNQQGFSARDLVGRDRWEVWTPARTGWTDVGSPTVTGRFRIVGKSCEFQVRVVPGTTCATVAGTSYIALPVLASGIAGVVTMSNATTNVGIGVGAVDITNSRAYVPAQAATANTLHVFGRYEIG